MKPSFLATAILLAAPFGYAQTPTGITTPVAHRSSALVGANVVHQSKTIGKVTDLVINDNGCIDYLVVSYSGGFIPVPWLAAQVNYELRGVTFRNANLPTANLQALMFTKAWPNFTDTVVLQRMRDVWGAAAVPNTTPAPETREGVLTPGAGTLRTPPAVAPPGLNPGDGLPRPIVTTPPASGSGTPSVARTRNETGVPRTTPATGVPVQPNPGNEVPASPPPR